MAEAFSTYRAMQVRAAEAPLLAAGEPLMRRAAAALASVVRDELTDAASSRVLVLVGGGDNGGDALFAAAELASVTEVRLLLLSDRFHEEGLATAIAAGAARVELPEARDAASGYDVLIDGMVGIGSSASSALRGTAREAVELLLPAVRAGRPRVVAVDVPSGLNPDTGEADDTVLPAAVTVTFGAVKAGLASGRGPSLCGRIVLVELGLERGLADEVPAGEASVDRVVRG
ncbi:NAD(P)H-hydrate epimerase [Microbacterium deminutum]|uniref:NAD(P)H-hydrate epimerase n=1 Tax=Microbacterium deminutum TaxID=344164 RepID=A0ABN2QBG4_9MICO